MYSDPNKVKETITTTLDDGDAEDISEDSDELFGNAVTNGVTTTTGNSIQNSIDDDSQDMDLHETVEGNV